MPPSRDFTALLYSNLIWLCTVVMKQIVPFVGVYFIQHCMAYHCSSFQNWSTPCWRYWMVTEYAPGNAQNDLDRHTYHALYLLYVGTKCAFSCNLLYIVLPSPKFIDALGIKFWKLPNLTNMTRANMYICWRSPLPWWRESSPSYKVQWESGLIIFNLERNQVEFFTVFQLK